MNKFNRNYIPPTRLERKIERHIGLIECLIGAGMGVLFAVVLYFNI